MRDLTYIASRLFDTPLLIDRGKLDVILSVLSDRLNIQSPLAEIPPHVAGPRAATGMDADDLQPGRIMQMRTGEPGRRVEEDKPYQVVDGVAVVPAIGVLVQRAGWLDAMSGLTAYAHVAAAAEQAVADPAVRHVFLDVDSPGGEVHGAFDATDRIFALRGEKPITAMVNELSASGGYALASAADRIVQTRTSLAGSVGVVVAHADRSGADEKEGVVYTYIYRGERKIDGSPHRPLTEEARAAIEDKVDRTYELFVETVARNRGLDTKAVRDTEAAVYQGSQAVQVRLADSVSSATAELNRLRNAVRGVFPT